MSVLVKSDVRLYQSVLITTSEKLVLAKLGVHLFWGTTSNYLLINDHFQLCPFLILTALLALVVCTIAYLRNKRLRKELAEGKLQIAANKLLIEQQAKQLRKANELRSEALMDNTSTSITNHPGGPAISDKTDDLSQSGQDDQRFLISVEEHILTNISQPDFGNENLAALLFISSRTLSRRLKVLTGLSTNKFMLEVRLKEARQLLESSPRPTLASVAAAVGFQKISYFSSRFRERFGNFPSEHGR